MPRPSLFLHLLLFSNLSGRKSSSSSLFSFLDNGGLFSPRAPPLSTKDLERKRWRKRSKFRSCNSGTTSGANKYEAFGTDESWKVFYDELIMFFSLLLLQTKSFY